MKPADYSFTRYLSAKKTVDDRALNRVVWQTLVDNLPKAGPDRSLQVLEVGAGIGTMVERALDWGLFSHARYTAIDNQAENIAMAHKRLKAWVAGNGYSAKASPIGLEISRDEKRVDVGFEDIDLYDFIARESGRRLWDLLVAHAFLDLVDLPATLPQLFGLLSVGGLFYFTLNFDGVSVLEPRLDAELDEKIFSLYHRTMDERMIAGKNRGKAARGGVCSSRLGGPEAGLFRPEPRIGWSFHMMGNMLATKPISCVLSSARFIPLCPGDLN